MCIAANLVNKQTSLESSRLSLGGFSCLAVSIAKAIRQSSFKPERNRACRADRMHTAHRVVFGDCRKMREVPDGSIQLTVTSPPYYNAPFDYPGMFRNYDEFLELIQDLCRDLFRVTAPGRIVCFVTDDMLVKGEKYPVVADITKLMRDAGFRYRDRIVWVKPKGYVRISRRSGVVLQHPYPMYYYPDNIQESILIFQKGRFDYSHLRELSSSLLERSKIPLGEYNDKEWALTVWNITNVLPLGERLEKGIAAFPEEIPRRLIKLFSFQGETVLDPFLGSGTTMKVAQDLGRNSWGYEIDPGLKKIIRKKFAKRPTDAVTKFESRPARMISRHTVKARRRLVHQVSVN
jgi:modification methylase